MARTKKTSTQDIINIKSLPVQAHIGASKYVNDDWGTIAFIIPRNQLQLKFADVELRYNCIYFLFGFDQTTEKVYVGQAKKRNSGESVLARLREHDTSTTERYCDIWEWVIVCTGKEDTWSLDDLNALEHAFYNEIPIEQNLNGNNPNSGGANYDAYIDKIKQIKNYITSIGFNIFADTEDTEKIQVTSEVNENTIVEDLQNGLARIPEIVTPHKVVKAMCDMLPPEVWNDQTVFLDPACKGGEYLREIFDRLMDCEILQAKYPNELERSLHVLKNQIYGIALSQVSFERTAKKLMGYDNNIRVIPNYISKLKGVGLGSRPDGTSKTIQDILNEEFNKDMKIDVVIGNPPYQESTGGGKRGSTAKQIYPFFILRAIELSSKYVTMITPSKWYNDSALKEFRNYFVSNIKYIHDYTNSSTIFNGVDIAGGVNYFLWQRAYNGDCEFVNNNRGIVDKSFRNLKLFDIVIRYSKLQAIIEKIYTQKNISSMVSSQTPFGYTTSDIDELSILDDEYYNIKVLGSSGREAYTNIKEIPKGKEYVSKYKVMMNHVTSEHAGETDKNGMVNILSSVGILGKNEICTQTYMFVGALDNLCDARNLEKYIKTKLVRACILATVASISLSPNNFRFAPLQDFTSSSDIDWSQSISDIDQQLYRKYGLTQEEIDYIEKTIKPMK